VVAKQDEADLLQRGDGGGNLGEHLRAVALLLDHLGDAVDLSRDPREAAQQVSVARLVGPRGAPTK
jgi:hypothetical protein